MSQSSAPADGVPFPDDVWRALFTRLGDGILDDKTNAALGYVLTKPGSGNDVQLGTGSSAVAGFYHGCAGPEPLTIPAVTSGSARTDVITVRYDPTFTTGVFPCRLFRVAGTPGAGVPATSQSPSGAWDLPLYNITRSAGQALSAATTLDRRKWIAGGVGSGIVTPDLGASGTPTAPLQDIKGVRTLTTDSVGRATLVFPSPGFPTAFHSMGNVTLETSSGGFGEMIVGTGTKTQVQLRFRAPNGSPYSSGTVKFHYSATGF